MVVGDPDVRSPHTVFMSHLVLHCNIFPKIPFSDKSGYIRYNVLGSKCNTCFSIVMKA